MRTGVSCCRIVRPDGAASASMTAACPGPAARSATHDRYIRHTDHSGHRIFHLGVAHKSLGSGVGRSHVRCTVHPLACGQHTRRASRIGHTAPPARKTPPDASRRPSAYRCFGPVTSTWSGDDTCHGCDGGPAYLGNPSPAVRHRRTYTLQPLGSANESTSDLELGDSGCTI